MSKRPFRRYAPDFIGIVSRVDGRFYSEARVRKIIAHPRGAHPRECPLIADCVAVELQTEHGSRWYGFDNAYIDSRLRMVCERAENRDEVLAKWRRVRRASA